jgi:hypothetical protein
MRKQIQENGMPPLTSTAYAAAPSTSREAEVQDALAAAARGSALNAPAGCPMCEPLNRMLQVAFSRLRSAEMRLEAQILLGKEAGERSAARVGGYDALEMLYARHGVPFKHESGIPPAFQKIFPRHEGHDGIRRGIYNKIAREAAGAGGTTSIPLNSDHSRDSDGATDSEESIPSEFQPRDSERTLHCPTYFGWTPAGV